MNVFILRIRHVLVAAMLAVLVVQNERLKTRTWVWGASTEAEITKFDLILVFFWRFRVIILVELII